MEHPTTDRFNSDDNLTTVVSIVDQFEEAWQRGLAPEIEDYLPAPDSPHRQRTLVELIRIDVELRLRSQLDAQVKDYLRRYPHLAPTEVDGSLVLDWSVRDGPSRTGSQDDSEPGPSFAMATSLFPPQTQVEPGSVGPGQAGSGPASPAPRHRRYRLTGLHAEGGIGQIWTAHDRDLDREVALKRLQPGGATNSAAQARFVREARVTGKLQHPGIVPVYEFCPAGAEPELFYTMRLIKGRTLRQAIQDYHQKRQQGQAGPLDLRELLGALLSVCQTIAYAHSRGVIHRDIKGDNVVLGDFGEVMVVDWGLAKVIGEPEPPPAGDHPPAESSGEAAIADTVEGSILGTPSYMPPEQAAGRVDLIEPRSDVYGLGGILYEILTGEPPFRGNVLDVLRRVIEEAPTAPSRRATGVAPALEAICLKCLAKSPGDRYASATDLARDLQRYLADEPVSAFAEPWTFKVRRWVGRHRTIATATAAALLVATISLAAATVVLERSNQREAQTRTRAEVNYELANEAVDHFFTRVSENPRLMAYGVETLRRDLLREARDFFERLAGQGGGEPEFEVDRARNLLRLAKITVELGEPDEAVRSSSQARSLFGDLALRSPNRPEYQEGLAMAFDSLGSSESGALRLAEARDAFQEAIAVWQALADVHPESPKYRFQLAATSNRLGRLLCLKLHDAPEGVKVLDQSIALCRRLVHEDPAAPDYRSELAEGLVIRGFARSGQEFSESETLLGEGLELREALAAERPDRLDYEARLVEACVFVATAYSNARVLNRVQTIHDRVRQISDRLAREHPDVPLFVENHHLIEILFATLQAFSGDHVRAAAVTETAVAGARRSGIVLLYAACLYSVASESARRDPQLSGSDREARAERYLARAMEYLRDARATGLFRQPWFRSGLENDPDLAALRARPEFPRFLAELADPPKRAP